MKKNSSGEVSISASEIQALRLNKLEYHRLQRNINILHDDLQVQLGRLQRQAQGLKYHYANVVRVVKPNQPYQLWKQAHAYEIAQDYTKNWIESIKLQQKSKSKTHQQEQLFDEVPSEIDRPLLLLAGNDKAKPTEPIINLNENFLRPKTSPVNKHLSKQHRENPLLTMLNEQVINSTNPIRTQPTESGSVSFLPPIKPPTSRTHVQNKIITAQKPSNIDTLYRIALQNQTAYKSVEQTRIVRRKLIDKEFASQHRALQGTIRSTVLVK